MAIIIDGKALAARLRSQVKFAVEELIHKHNLRPGLAVVLVGHHPPSQVYVRNKAKQTTEVGMASFTHELDESVSQHELLSRVSKLNHDERVHGILVQLPLPSHIDTNAVINAIDPQKDVDGFTVTNAGLLATGQNALVPCTPLGCLMMLRHVYDHSLSGRHGVVVGRSNIVGKPMASLLLRENCTVSVAHSRTENLPALCASADILVAAVGRPHFIQGDWVKEGATVIDVGINRISIPNSNKTKLVGDVDFHAAARLAGAITPVPGGVGPMTIACLLINTLTACCRISDTTIPSNLSF